MLPAGWTVERKNDVLDTVIVVAPNGYTAITSKFSNNPANVLRMLALDLLSLRDEDDDSYALEAAHGPHGQR